MSNIIEVEGLLGQDPELRYTSEGLAIATFNVADSPRKFNRETQKWESAGETIWYRVSVFGNAAEISASQLEKGSPVLVKGTLSFKTWETKTGEKRENKEIRADKVFLSLRKTGGSLPPSSSDWHTETIIDDSPF